MDWLYRDIMDVEFPQPVPIRRLRVIGFRCPLCSGRLERVLRWTTYREDETGATVDPLQEYETQSRFVPCGCEHVYDHQRGG